LLSEWLCVRRHASNASDDADRQAVCLSTTVRERGRYADYGAIITASAAVFSVERLHSNSARAADCARVISASIVLYYSGATRGHMSPIAMSP